MRRAALVLAALIGSAAAASAEPARLTITVKPVRDEAPSPRFVAVRQALQGVEGAFSLRVPISNVGRSGIADRVDDLAVRDALGPVPLKVEDDPASEGGYAYFRHWRAQRPVKGTVVTTYRMRPQPKPSGGPQFEFYSHNGGLNSSGEQLFVLPEDLADVAARVQWDLSDLPKGSIAVSTWGQGAFERRGPADELRGGYYLVGPLGRYEPRGANPGGFEAYWLGRPAAEPNTEMAWLARGYDYMRAFWRDEGLKTYRVFIQTTGQGGGSAAANSFMGAWAPGLEDPAKEGPRLNVFHEISHYFVGGLQQAQSDNAPWYGEGANTHYTRLLAFRAGLIPLDAYIEDVNRNARGYYTNPYRNRSADEVRRLGFSTGFGADGAQNLAYTRGSLMWADIDYDLRQASGGARGLDDVLVPLVIARREGKPLTEEVLLAALGPAVRAKYESAIVRGETLVPQSGAFGPCLERRATTFEARGERFEGHEWVRVPGVSEEDCRRW